jgi:hypothetical protein
LLCLLDRGFLMGDPVLCVTLCFVTLCFGVVDIR